MVKPVITGPEVQALLRDSAGIRCRAEGELTDGWFNAVFQIRTGDGRRAIVKIAPRPGTPVLRYEQGIMSTEAMFCRQAGARHGIRLPELLGEGPGFLVMSGRPGAGRATTRARADRRPAALAVLSAGQVRLPGARGRPDGGRLASGVHRDG